MHYRIIEMSETKKHFKCERKSKYGFVLTLKEKRGFLGSSKFHIFTGVSG